MDVKEINNNEGTGFQGRQRIQKSKDQKKWFDNEREKIQAYEYLCHIGEVKEWMESILKEELPEIVHLEEALRDGVLMAKLMQIFAPECVKKIHVSKKLEFKHSNNINYVFDSYKKLGLPPVFHFELIDLYDKKNIPKVIFSIHALSYLLNAKGLAPSINDLVGKLEFTDDHLAKTKKDIDNRGMAMPLFSGVKAQLNQELVQEGTQFHEMNGILIDKYRYINLGLENAFKDPEFVCSVNKLTDYAKTLRFKLLFDAKRAAYQNTEAITKLQSLTRGLVSRKAYNDKVSSYKASFEENKESLLQLQAALRGNLSRANWTKRMEPINNNPEVVNQIQAYSKGLIARSKYEKVKTFLRNNASSVIKFQANLRRHVVRQYHNDLLIEESPRIAVITKFLGMLEETESDILDENELERLRQLLITTIKNNKVHENDLNELETKIALLVKNRTTLNDIISNTGFLNIKRSDVYGSDGSVISPNGAIAKLPHCTNTDEFSPKSVDKKSREKLRNYQYLFYLLQTKPEYLSKIMRCSKDSVLDKSSKLYELIVLNIFNNGQNSREEFLLLNMFKALFKEELTTADKLDDFLRENPLFIKLAIQYSRGEKERGYLCDLLKPIVLKIVKDERLSLESDPLNIYKSLIKDEESKSGVKSSKPYEISREAALKDPEVKAVFIQHLEKLRDLTTEVMQLITQSLHKMPYGLRYISKELKSCLTEKFPNEPISTIIKVVGNLVYYRYINPAIIAPEILGLTDIVINISQRKNLAEIAKMLNQISAGKIFGDENIFLQPLNNYILTTSEKFSEYLDLLCDVPEPTDYFGIDEYLDVTSSRKPTIYVSLREIINIHTFIVANIDAISPNLDDKLRVVIKELGEVPNVENQDSLNQEVTLMLFDKYPDLKESESETAMLLNKVKRLTMTLLKVKSGNTLLEILQTAVTEADQLRYLSELETKGSEKDGSQDESQLLTIKDIDQNIYPDTFEKLIEELSKSLEKLESMQMVNKEDGYQNIINTIAKDIKNKGQSRKQRKQDIAKVRENLNHVMKLSKDLNDQKDYYRDYIINCIQKSRAGKGQKHKISFFSKQYFHNKSLERAGLLPKYGSYRYSAEKLYNKGVLVSIDDIDVKGFNRISLQISSDEAGIFDVSAYLLGVKIPDSDMVLKWDELLQAQYDNTVIMPILNGKVKVNVNLLIYLLNKK